MSRYIILKKYCEIDLEKVYSLKSNSLVWQFSDKKVIEDIEQARKYLNAVLNNYEQNNCDFQALFRKDTQEYIGEAGILSFSHRHSRATIGYNLLPEYWGNCYATEITKAIIKWLIEEKSIERVEALVCDENRASKKVLEKSGFMKEGLLRNYAFIGDRYVDVCYYGLVRRDYFDGRVEQRTTDK